MSDWPGKWKLENFEEALGEWAGGPVPSPEVLAEVEQWHYSLQDNPRGSDCEPFENQEGMFSDHFPMRCRVFTLRRHPLLVEGRPVVCYYEIQENEHRIVFSHFGLL
ncbi:hypothetical protein [Actinoplanes rectilineatus]|uniref:hypothetical protein n=1 Tax=Actinoplanes rectilineatus TaxID=113571 RepID=UPI0005F2D957|nr:hypothetical protein [Actinoplanes rectilineatus]